MLKLLFYSDCFLFGGCEKILVNLINDTRVKEQFEIFYAYRYNRDYEKGVRLNFSEEQKKFAITLLTNDNIFYFLDNIRKKNFFINLIYIPFKILRKSGIYFLFNFIRLFILFVKIKPDILHINNGGYPGASSCRTAVFSAKLAGIKNIIFTINNLAYPRISRIDRKIDNFISKNVNIFTVATIKGKDILIKNRKFPERKIIQIYNTMRDLNITLDKSRLMDEYSVKDKFIIVEVALLTERKGQITLLESLLKLRSKYKDVFDNIVLFLVGSGEDESKIRYFIKKNGLEGSVIMTGYRNDYDNYINAADLFILPSIKDEDMPLVILTSMRLGKAVISTDVGGISEEIENNISGIILDPGELNNLAEKIAVLYKDKILREKFGSNAMQRYKDLFAFDRFVMNYIGLYRNLAGL